ESWIRVDSTKIPSSNGKEFGVDKSLAISGNYAWFGTQNDIFGISGRVFRSEDRGNTWSAISINDIRAIGSVAFSTDSIGVIICDLNKIGYTRNGGLSWTFPRTIPFLGYNVCFATTSSFIIVGGTWSYVSTDGGNIFNERETNYSNSLQGVSFANSSDGWAVGSNGAILKWIGGQLPDLPVSVEENKNNIPSDFELKQNYPNPFNPTTKIQYSTPKSDFVILKVYNLLGKEIATLVNEYKSPGKYEIEFHATDLPSGVYFYTLSSGNYSQTKKILLLR
ncbi:MAG: T9SS type A sorting domain-containing protein, partial [Ignavibacteria bacterium]|nr:T9SS type A sorting domain-containing protein [Ignavibacteria bacterium]